MQSWAEVLPTEAVKISVTLVAMFGIEIDQNNVFDSYREGVKDWLGYGWLRGIVLFFVGWLVVLVIKKLLSGD